MFTFMSIALVLTTVALVIFLKSNNNFIKYKRSIKPGQLFYTETNETEKDPFKRAKVQKMYYKVLDIKEGYVQYILCHVNGKDIKEIGQNPRSCTLDYFATYYTRHEI